VSPQFCGMTLELSLALALSCSLSLSLAQTLSLSFSLSFRLSHPLSVALLSLLSYLLSESWFAAEVIEFGEIFMPHILQMDQSNGKRPGPSNDTYLEYFLLGYGKAVTALCGRPFAGGRSICTYLF